MINKETKFDLNDFSLMPEVFSDIRSRKEVNILTPEKRLPIITAPMTSVIDTMNWGYFRYENIIPCLPRNNYVDSPFVINSVSLEEFDLLVAKLESKRIGIPVYNYLLVDIANGHLKRLYDLVEKFVNLKTDIKLIIGNIANPLTFTEYAKLGIWGVRCSIGSGAGCLTAVHTGVFYPLASLISECYSIKKEGGYETRIIADGGLGSYSDIIKMVAIGADYCMLGNVLNKALESAGETRLFGFNIDGHENAFWEFKFLRKYITKCYYGMSTKRAQREWGKEVIKTSEGIEKTQKCEYTLSGWTENFEHYLSSALSYTNSRNLEEFKESQKIFITDTAFKRYSK